MGDVAVTNLGIILPSIHPNELTLDFVPSLAFFRQGMEHINVKLLICAQPPWEEFLIRRVARDTLDFGIETRYVMAEAENPPRMCYLRQQAANLWPQADVYMLADDNMVFQPGTLTPEIRVPRGSGERYAEVLDYMASYPYCGLVQCHTSDPANFGASIGPTNNGLVTTNKGLFIRNVAFGILWPDETHKFYASLEETVAGYLVLERGYFAARQYHNPTRHAIHKVGSDEGLHSRDLIEVNAGRWIRERYDDACWEHEYGCFPQKLIDLSRQRGDRHVSFRNRDPSFLKDY